MALERTVPDWRTAGGSWRVHGNNIAGNECCKVVLSALAAGHRYSPSCRGKFAASCCRLDVFKSHIVRSADRSDINSLRFARPTLSPVFRSRWMLYSVRLLTFDPGAGVSRPRRRIFTQGTGPTNHVSSDPTIAWKASLACRLS